jgi:hypothetical protein
VTFVRILREHAQAWREIWSLPEAARIERNRDREPLPSDPGAEPVLRASLAWLCEAQDRSASADGGVARSYDLLHGWETSYPETTGYIVPTFLEYATRFGRPDLRERARQMCDWLAAIQLAEGGFQGGRIDSVPAVPVTFNTGQILIGLAVAQAAFGSYLIPMRRAADWLVQTQDSDGCWRRHPTPFAAPGEKEYETHVAWGLFEADRVEPSRGYGEAGLSNVRWALSEQHPDGWLPRCCLDDPSQPLTHTIGYALRGVLEAYRFQPDPALLDSARRIADGLLHALAKEGRLAGRLKAGWIPAAPWVCLTGACQVAVCWMLLYRITREWRYAEAAFAANSFVRRTVRLDGPAATRGAVKGAFPIDGDYGRFQYLNWAAKFLADSLMLEMELRRDIEHATQDPFIAVSHNGSAPISSEVADPPV